MIETGWETSTVSFTEQLLPSEDLNDRIDILNKHVDALNENSMKFINLFYDIIINEEQKGEIVESMEENMKKLQNQHSMFNEAFSEKSRMVVNKLDIVVEENKTQKASATYYVSTD